MAQEFNKNLFHNNKPCSEVHGKIRGQSLPGWIQGIFLYNSPAGVFDHKVQSVNHWMDGLSIISSFKIQNKGNQVIFNKNYLKSDAFIGAQNEGKSVKTELGTPRAMVQSTYQGSPSFQSYHGYRRRFGQNSSLMRYNPMGIDNMMGQDATDNCNCSFYQFGNLTMATNEMTAYERVIHPETVSTRDIIDMSRFVNIKTGRPLRDHNGDYYNLAASFITGNKYHFVKFPKASSEMNYGSESYPNDVKYVATIPSRFPNHIGYFHTFGMTDKYLIFCEQPMAFDVRKLKTIQAEGRTYKDCLDVMCGERNRFYIVEKKSAYDASNIFDNMWMDRLRSHDHCGSFFNNSKIMRFVLPLDYYEENIDLNHGRWMGATAIRHKEVITLRPQHLTHEKGMEYPKINPHFYFRKYEYTYVIGWIHGLDPKNYYANAVTKN
ncbi:RPE65 [Lepeophtheirus salmonis]|uniref:RPE65 n=1 Tax=Lepeophtheirus salmonis TaxID=72036 RepID=A0A7R8H783_LEPSM|nr:RPE65 [Lepeophtheirus salmonis]CAF2903083.1 RPE65 [Lepeophtheirus salmonis]